MEEEEANLQEEERNPWREKSFKDHDPNIYTFIKQMEIQQA